MVAPSTDWPRQPRLFERWTAAMLPDPVTVAEVRLRPLTYGHAMLLARLTGWQPLTTPFPPEDLPLGLFVASRDWREAAREFPTRRARKFLERVARNVTLEEAVEGWCRYLDQALVIPGVRKQQLPGPAKPPPGAPFLLRLRLFAFKTLGIQAGLEDFVLADLVWLWLAHVEEEGGIRIRDDEDADFESWCREQERNGQSQEANA